MSSTNTNLALIPERVCDPVIQCTNNKKHVSFNSDIVTVPKISEIVQKCPYSVYPSLDSKKQDDLLLSAYLTERLFPEGVTPLMIAAMDGDVEMCRKLVSLGCPINQQDDRLKTALMYACREGSTDVVLFLIEAGADVSLTTKSGYNALMCAAYNGHADIVKILCSYIPVDCQDEDGFTPLMCSVVKDHAHVVDLLLSLGVDTTLTTTSHHTAMMLALERGNVKVLNSFIHRGVRLRYESNGQHCGALYYAVAYRNVNVMSCVIVYSSYLREFLDDLVCYPDTIKLECIERYLVGLSKDKSNAKTLSTIITNQALLYLSELVLLFQTNQPSADVHGLVKTALWSISICIIISGSTTLGLLTSFFNVVEVLLAKISESWNELLEQHVLSNDAVEASSILSPFQISLLFSLLELYCVGLRGMPVSVDSLSQLPSLLKENQPYLISLAHENMNIVSKYYLLSQLLK